MFRANRTKEGIHGRGNEGDTVSERDFYLTTHAAERVRQRGLRDRDLELVFECGTPTQEAVLLTGKDVAREIETCRRRMAQLERLRGTALIVAESVVVTVYRPDTERTKRLLGRKPKPRRVRPRRHARGRSLPAYAGSAP
jgi:hypothetical protein